VPFWHSGQFGCQAQALRPAMDTNTIHVVLPPGESLHVATAAFRQFGEVSSLELLPGDALIASVVFFDVRAAWSALGALGYDLAQPAPQSGCRVARLRGDTNLKIDDVSGVSNVFYDSKGDGDFAVEFYDVRDAARFQELAEQELSEPRERTPGFACPGRAPTGLGAAGADATGAGGQQEEPVPVYVIPTAIPISNAVRSMGAAAGATAATGATPPAALQEELRPSREMQPTHYTVRVTGLPNALLSTPCMEAVLQQAGLLEAAINFRTNEGEHCGEAVVTFLSFAMAEQCIAHFQGRQWNTSGEDVIAWLEPYDSAAPGDWAGADCRTGDEVWRKRCDSSNTEVSTEVGPLSEQEEEREGEVPSS